MSGQINEIVAAVKAIHDVSTPNDKRIEYTKAIENLKDNDPYTLIPLAFQLVNFEDIVVQHVGWNILDHLIRYTWVRMPLELLIQMRDGVLKHMLQRQFTLDSQDSSIKTALVRSLVLMIEQEWPQNWPDLIDNFKNVIFLKRLIEDVVTLSNIENTTRRKDLYNSLVVSINDIISITLFRIHKCISTNLNENVLLVKSALELISETMVWVPIKSVNEKLTETIEVCCLLLSCSSANVHKEAAECLYKLVCKKRSKTDETFIIHELLKKTPVQAILTAANEAAIVGAASPEYYKFLKVLTDLLCELGLRITETWKTLGDVDLDTFPTYLTALFALFNHPSLIIRGDISAVIISMVLNPDIANLPQFKQLMEINLTNFVKYMKKVGSISKNDNDTTSHYCRMDYDNEMDFTRDFVQLRARCCRIVQTTIADYKDKYFNIMADWLQNRCLTVPQDITNAEWECFQKYIKTVVNSAYEKEIVDSTTEDSLTFIFDSVFRQLCTINDLKLANEIMSICSPLFNILRSHPDRIVPILNQCKYFLFLENNELYEVKVIKRHIMIIMCRLVTMLSDVIQPYADNVYQVCCEAFSHVTIMQRGSLVQVLSALSNLCLDSNVKSNFLYNALKMNIEYIGGDDFQEIIKSPANFFQYVGFNVEPIKDNNLNSSIFIKNRVTLKSNLYTIEGALQQVTVPENVENPLYQILLPLLPKLFRFGCILNEMYDPKYASLIHPSYGEELLQISKDDRRVLLTQITETDFTNQSSPNTYSPLEHAQLFISDLHDCVQSILGSCGSRLYLNFYEIPLCNEMLKSLVTNVTYTPYNRLRFWIKRTWSPLLSKCPLSKLPVIGPMLFGIVEHLTKSLDKLWRDIENFDTSDDQSEDEVLMEHITCTLTRETVSMYRLLFLTDSIAPNGKSGDESKKMTKELLNEKGSIILKEQSFLNNFIPNLMRILTCKDTQSAIRSLSICRIVVDTIKDISTEQIAKYLLTQALLTIQIHGSDEVAVGPILLYIYTIYSTFRPKYPDLYKILAEVPEATEENLSSFDTRVMNIIRTNEQIVEKTKRDIVRKVLKPIIAMNIGQQHKRPAHLKQLPKIEKLEKFKAEADYSGISVLFSP
ncbi:Exportin-5 [Strongyloides ratti]|uniref:Exportin-5 n=1 Tax=Strongyloides ratti TaxID=34506 RepID=A0A090LHK7_STRRB|nr:Exportin-5 [Strongyloides ratti]CEF69276.1 Exportin-5 [Strongyloides ratti]